MSRPELGDLQFWSRPAAERDQAFAWLRANEPVAFHQERSVIEGGRPGPGFWSITRHTDVREVNRLARVFSSAKGNTITEWSPQKVELFGSMIAMDDPRHARMRRVVSGGFTPRMLAKLETTVQEVAREILDEVGPTGGCDFVTDIAAALPLRIVCDLMGIPGSLYQHVFEQTNVILGVGDPEFVPPGVNRAQAVMDAGAALNAVMTDLAAVRRKNPTDDLTSTLLQAEVEGERLTDRELGSFFNLLVAAGNETTRNAISWGLVLLTQHPDQRRIWQSDFEAVAPTAVDEIVRYASPVIHFRRTVTADTEVGGQPVKKGDKVVMWYGSANRDERVFDDPGTFDVTRSPNEHVGFGGGGPHFCLGANLARREIRVMFEELFRWLPDIAMTGEPDYLQSGFIHGIKRMTCEFTPTEIPRLEPLGDTL